MKITPRENLLRSLRCGNPEWIPVCVHLFPNENPTRGIPADLKPALDNSSGNLLPVYRKTRMHGIDAFSTPPAGDVGFAEGRKIMGAGYSICAGISGGAGLSDAAIRAHVAARFHDARAAGDVVFYVIGSGASFSKMEKAFAAANGIKRR